MINGKRITLLVGGSIAAYKSAELTRELVKQGAKVHVVLSRAATEFITPLTMQTLSGNTVTSSLFDVAREAEINHIRLADEADVLLVAPATADIIAKAASGIADDSLSTVLLASTAPKIIAPAMNVNMWKNPITQRNVQTLQGYGFHFVQPATGELACGWYGEGRLAELADIIHAVKFHLAPKDLAGQRVVVTAGPTRGLIDPVRFVSNRSSGKMGYAIAEQAALRGADVVLITGPTALVPPLGVRVEKVLTAGQMREALLAEVLSAEPMPPKGKQNANGANRRQLVFMVAAVTDHIPKESSPVKLKPEKSKGYSLEMAPCPDILQELGTRKDEIVERSGRALTLVGFSAETGTPQQVLSWAKGKLEKKHVDVMIGNSVDEAFENETNHVWILRRSGEVTEVAKSPKSVVAARIIDIAKDI